MKIEAERPDPGVTPAGEEPRIIQGGMGVGVSGWRLARSVATRGQMGVVSGTGLDTVVARRLQLGDPGGHLRRALAAFPDSGIAERLLERYFVPGGKPAGRPFKSKPMVGRDRSRELDELLVAAGFAEVFLAKEGHGGTVGINFLHKIQTPLLPSLYGAMLAGVDAVVVGAGIPLKVPGVLDGLSRNEPVELELEVRAKRNGHGHPVSFDPAEVLDGPLPELRRPRFFPIVSSATLAGLLVKKCRGGIDGLVVEAPSAGGHNAPPRGAAKRSREGEPIYGPRDAVDLEAIRSHGLPFWLAGSRASPEELADARAVGAAGVQVGTLFAFSEESGLREDLKRDVVERCRGAAPRVFTDPVASPTGFPFKVVPIRGTLSEAEGYAGRRRRCDLGYLREAYERPDGSLGWRCPAEDEEMYVRKGGAREETAGRKCLCNGLMADIGLGQVRRDGAEELPLVTCGDDLSGIARVLGPDRTSYTSADVVDFLLG